MEWMFKKFDKIPIEQYCSPFLSIILVFSSLSGKYWEDHNSLKQSCLRLCVFGGVLCLKLPLVSHLSENV